MSFTPTRPLAYACLALSMSLVGSYVALSKPLVAAIPVFLLAWLRFGIGGLAMLHWLRKPAGEPPLAPRTRRLLFLESFLGNFLFSICMLYGVSLTSAVSAGVIMAAIPATVALLSRVFLREPISARTGAAIACAALGIGLLAAAQPHAQAAAAPGRLAWLGNLLVFGAVLCEASYAVIGKALTGALGPKRITALINLWGFALVTPFGLYTARHFEFAAVPTGAWVLLVFYAPWLGTSRGALISIVVSMVATIAWFLMGNPFGIDNAYVALLLPLVVMAGSSLLAWLRTGEAFGTGSGQGSQ